MKLTPGLILCNDYELVEPIGKGGMGAIWRAKDLPGNRDVALKFVPQDVQNFESEMDRVEDAFAAVHALQHQNICPLYAMKNSGSEFGFFLVMKFIPGVPLGKFVRQVQRQTGDFTVAQLVTILRPIAEALDYAHTRRPPVIHRDIKPANIMVMADDDLCVQDVQLIDFGLAATFRASLTRVSQVKLSTSGTRPYMAPEQWEGAYQNAATDQYALGITAYELLSGRFPFESDDFAILEKCVKTAPVPPIETLSKAQNAVLRRALGKTRDERFPTCSDFIEALASAPTEDFNSVEEEPTICDPIAPLPAKVDSGRKAGERKVLTANEIEYAFRWCPPGEFMMGGNLLLYFSERPVHKVLLTKGFWLQETQVTQAMWRSVMGNNPSKFNGKGFLGIGAFDASNHPVERMTWGDCLEFCRKLSQMLGRQVQLPTEAQWEYACRAGTLSDYAGDLNSMAWFGANSGPTSPVARKQPNAWGLYDMHGNVNELCSDYYARDYYSRSPMCDPENTTASSHHVARGGAWCSHPLLCRSACRCYDSLGNWFFGLIGFRLLLVPGPDD